MCVPYGSRFDFFLPPYVVFGRGTRSTIPEYTDRLGIRRVLLVIDPFFTQTELSRDIQYSLDRSHIQVATWDRVVPNPTDTSIDEAFSAYKEDGCNGLIAVGGGSAMDTAKAVGVLVCSGAESIRQHMPPTSRRVEGMAPMILAPTTSGTGAEVNPYAVVTNSETNAKDIGYPASALLAAQKVAVVDPDLSVSMPPELTAATGMDAFCHALECYISDRPNPISDLISLQAIGLVARNLRQAVHHGGDMAARTNMSLAATMAAMAFQSAGLSYPHRLSTVLVQKLHISHGVACAANLLATLEFMLPLKLDRLVRVATAFGVLGGTRSREEMALAGISEIRQLLGDIHIPSLAEMTSATEDDIEEWMEALGPRLAGLSTKEKECARGILSRSIAP